MSASSLPSISQPLARPAVGNPATSAYASKVSKPAALSNNTLHASAYANPIMISVLSVLSSGSANSPNKAPSPTSTSGPAVLVNDFPQPSQTTPMPNLACPASEKESRPTNAMACDPNMQTPPRNTSAPVTSFAPNTLPLLKINPDSNGTYLDPNATTDQHAHCLDIAAHQYQICWQVLNITGYINDWISFNQAECDSKDMGFADCFHYIEFQDGANCTSFTGLSQCPSLDTRSFTGRTNGAHAYYVAFNIWNIQNWFRTYYQAVGGANGLASDNINMIARTLNIPTPKSISVLDILAGLAWAFGLISPSGYAERIPKLGEKIVGFGAQAPGEYLLRAVQGSPTLARNLVAKGDLSDTNVQIAEMGSDLARITAQLQTNIQNAIIVVMSNFSLFFDFVEDGFFSTQIENINTVAQNVTLALNTYLVSQALQDDNVIITRALDTDVNQLQLNGSAYQYDTGCGQGYDEWGMCGSWWYDSTNHISYGLESLKDMLNNYTDPLESLFNQGITTPELLFMNSQLCADASSSTQGNAPGTSLSTSTGIWNTECISNMKI
ncbi:MAG: hypothetical protein Q9218_007419, partial [Villophora microphyllina]